MAGGTEGIRWPSQSGHVTGGRHRYRKWGLVSENMRRQQTSDHLIRSTDTGGQSAAAWPRPSGRGQGEECPQTQQKDCRSCDSLTWAWKLLRTGATISRTSCRTRRQELDRSSEPWRLWEATASAAPPRPHFVNMKTSDVWCYWYPNFSLIYGVMVLTHYGSI